MSYTYLRHSRWPSQRVAPPAEDDSIDALLSPTSPTSHTLIRTQILTSTHPSPLTIAEQAPATEEPLPHIDYHLLSLLIRLVHSHLDNHGKKRYDYLIQARQWYYLGHAKFQEAFRNLQDANAYSIILRQHSERIVQANPTPTNPTPSTIPQSIPNPLDRARRANNESIRHHLLTVRQCAQARDHATSWLSSLKWKFLTTEMPPLIRYADELHSHLMNGGEGAAPPQIGTLPPIEHLEPDASLHSLSSAKDRSEEVGNGASILVIPEGAADEREMDERVMGADVAIAMAGVEQMLNT